MTFHEKLERRVREMGLNKARAARDVGLPESTISSYISNAKSLPRIDIAAKIATALKVPLAWLADDACGWPPPSQTSPTVSQFDNETLMLEVARRYRLEVLEFFNELQQAQRADIGKLLSQLKRWKSGQPPPHDAIKVAALFFQYGQLLRRWTVNSFADERHAELPGSSLPVSDFDIDAIAARYDAVAGSGAFKLLQQTMMNLIGAEGIGDMLKTQHRKPPALQR